MKPIGTVTKYYRFVDKKTEETLDYIMAEAMDFQDFVSRLGEKVYREHVSSALAHIAAVLAWQIEDEEARSRIGSKYTNELTVEPWTLQSYPVWHSEGLAVRDRFANVVNEAIGRRAGF